MKIPEREPIGRVMARAGKLFLTEIRNQLPDISINRSFYPLMLIYSGNGELTQQELANLLKIDKVQVVRIVDYLSQHGYVERINNSSDRRKHLLCTTSKATIAMPFILAAFESVTQMAMKGLSSEQKDMLYQSMGIIEANLISNRKIKTNES
ncbi:MAG: MarR family transcriptional regulator [Bacteroidales bacterium]|nr:MarR family transcriptional regulator [Bacteroidales bacterium]